MLTSSTHGSAYGSYLLAAAVSLAVVDLLRTGELQDHAQSLLPLFFSRTEELLSAGLVTDVCGAGLWLGADALG